MALRASSLLSLSTSPFSHLLQTSEHVFLVHKAHGHRTMNLVNGYTTQNQWFMTVWRKHNRMTHTPFGQYTNKLTALPENPVLIFTKNLYPKRQSISKLIILHLLTNSLDNPPLPLPGHLPCTTFLIVFVVVLLIPLPSLSPCFWFLIGLVIFPPSPGVFFVSLLVWRWRKDPGGLRYFHYHVWEYLLLERLCSRNI